MQSPQSLQVEVKPPPNMGLLERTKRYQEIVTVFAQWGLIEVTDKLPFVKHIHRKGVETLSRGERLQIAFGKLGGTFVKVGQILSTRPDLVPQDIREALKKLQDNVPPSTISDIHKLIENSLGRPIDKLYDNFEPTPIAAASIAQVYRACTKDGDDVAVKVLRPGIARQISIDIAILRQLAALSEHWSNELSDWDILGIIDELASAMRRETDLIWEGRNIERFRSFFKNDETIHIPKVFWELSSGSVLTMEFIDGIKSSEVDRLIEAGLEPRLIAQRGAKLIMKQIFEYGFFHADPHPGNIFILPDNVIAPLDYGMVGYLDRELRDTLLEIVIAVNHEDMDTLLRNLEQVVTLPSPEKLPLFRRELRELIYKYYGLELGQLNMHELAEDSFTLARNYKLHLSADLTLFAKALGALENLGRTLDANFNVAEFLRPYVEKELVRKWSPRRFVAIAAKLWDDILRTAGELPTQSRQILRKIEKGELSIKLEHRKLEELANTAERSSNRIAFALIIAALLISSSLVMHIDKGPAIGGFPLISLINYGVGVILGLWLVFQIIRKKRL